MVHTLLSTGSLRLERRRPGGIRARGRNHVISPRQVRGGETGESFHSCAFPICWEVRIIAHRLSIAMCSVLCLPCKSVLISCSHLRQLLVLTSNTVSRPSTWKLTFVGLGRELHVRALVRIRFDMMSCMGSSDQRRGRRSDTTFFGLRIVSRVGHLGVTSHECLLILVTCTSR